MEEITKWRIDKFKEIKSLIKKHHKQPVNSKTKMELEETISQLIRDYAFKRRDEKNLITILLTTNSKLIEISLDNNYILVDCKYLDQHVFEMELKLETIDC